MDKGNIGLLLCLGWASLESPVEESHNYIPFWCGNRDMGGPAEIIGDDDSQVFSFCNLFKNMSL